jgi:low affinity Fe/Cu permease
MIIVWLLTGSVFNYSDTWQLVINTTTSIITFLMVFIIQNSQNRDTAAIQAKLDELLRATEGAHNSLINLEDNEEEFLRKCQTQYKNLARIAAKNLENGTNDTGCPDIK